MTVQVRALPRATLTEFADEHGLDVEIVERREPHGIPRWYAHVVRGEVMERGMLAGVTGNGATRKAAMEDLAQRLSEKRLAIDAMRPTRRNIDVPVLTSSGYEDMG